MNRSKALFVWIAIVWLHGCAVADVYNMQGMEGRVVDKATQQPLDGVMVIEVWEAGGGFEGHTVAYLPLRETRTDSAGQYSFRARGAGKMAEGFLKEDTPRLIFFKPGYVFISERNRYHPDRRFEYNRRSDWDGKAIGLEKFEGSPQEWAKELERFSSVLGDFTGRGGRCIWMGVPYTLWVLYQEHNHLLKQGVLAKVAIGSRDVRTRLSECPSSEKFNEIFAHDID